MLQETALQGAQRRARAATALWEILTSESHQPCPTAERAPKARGTNSLRGLGKEGGRDC